MLGAHVSQFSPPTGGVGGALGYTSPGYYYLGAALQAVRRRKTSSRLFRDVSWLWAVGLGHCDWNPFSRFARLGAFRNGGKTRTVLPPLLLVFLCFSWRQGRPARGLESQSSVSAEVSCWFSKGLWSAFHEERARYPGPFFVRSSFLSRLDPTILPAAR